MTPEGAVKKDIRKLLSRFERVKVDMPVQNGMGSPMLDFHCVVNGYAMVIEAKAPGGAPTPRQEVTIRELRQAGAAVFVVSTGDTFVELEKWLDDHTSRKKTDRIKPA